MAIQSEAVADGSEATLEAAPETPVDSADGSHINRRFFTRLARGAIFALIIQIVGAGLGYLTQIAFARWMGLSQFGTYTYLMAWVTTLGLVVGLGFPTSVLRFIPEYHTFGDHDKIRGLIRWSRWATVATGLVIAVVGTAIAGIFTSSKTDTAVVLAVLLIPVGALINLDLAIIRAGGRVVGAFAPSLVIRPFLILVAAGAVWLASSRLTADTGLSITLAAFAVVALLQSRLIRDVVRRGKPPYSARYEPRRWLQVSAPLLLVAGFQIALGQTDILVLGTVGGARDAGLYLAASKTALLVGYLLVAVNAVAAPLFSELETKGDRAGLQRLATVSALWIFWPTLMVALGLALLAPYVLGLFGPDFVVAERALLILLVGQLVSAGCGSVGFLLSMTGHQNDLARVYGIIAVLNLAVCYAGVRAFGLNGAAGATSISLIVWNLWLHQVTVKRIGVRASIFSALALQKKNRSRSA